MPSACVGRERDPSRRALPAPHVLAPPCGMSPALAFPPAVPLPVHLANASGSSDLYAEHFIRSFPPSPPSEILALQPALPGPGGRLPTCRPSLTSTHLQAACTFTECHSPPETSRVVDAFQSAFNSKITLYWYLFHAEGFKYIFALNLRNKVHEVGFITTVLQMSKRKLGGAHSFLNPAIIEAPTFCQALGWAEERQP